MNVAAPELVGGNWLNTPDGSPIPLASRRGQVTILHFWTFGCINCENNLPAYARWHKQFANEGVVLIWVHTPETEAERIKANVIQRVRELAVEYPVLLDQDNVNWKRWHQQYWPTVYLIDKAGRIRFRWIGELNNGSSSGEARMAERVKQPLRESSEETSLAISPGPFREILLIPGNVSLRNGYLSLGECVQKGTCLM